MKTPLLGFIASTAVFAGTSIYLWWQLDAERARGAQTTELTRRLNARVAELEKPGPGDPARAVAAQLPVGPGRDPGNGMPRTAVAVAEPVQFAGSSAAMGPARQAALRKMLRVQMRAHTKRMYADFAEQLALDAEKAAALYDLIAAQASFGEDGQVPADPHAAHEYFQELQRQNQAKISDLLGYDGAETLRKYQETLPARSEVDAISEQLAMADAPIAADQRKRLVAAFSEERARVPMPEFVRGGEEAYAKAVMHWQDDYNERARERARAILDAQQRSAYDDMQQWQKDMQDEIRAQNPDMRYHQVSVGSGAGYSTSGFSLRTDPTAPAARAMSPAESQNQTQREDEP
jgi:hypothetical protein